MVLFYHGLESGVTVRKVNSAIHQKVISKHSREKEFEKERLRRETDLVLFSDLVSLKFCQKAGGDRDRGTIFGLRGPNAELPTGRETGWGSEFSGLRQQQ